MKTDDVLGRWTVAEIDRKLRDLIVVLTKARSCGATGTEFIVKDSIDVWLDRRLLSKDIHG
jgi:hypothetical protein